MKLKRYIEGRERPRDKGFRLLLAQRRLPGDSLHCSSAFLDLSGLQHSGAIKLLARSFPLQD
jgi:hypothetical protein